MSAGGKLRSDAPRLGRAFATSWPVVASYALVVLGMLQMVGFVTGPKVVWLVGRASAAAPFPQVFFDAAGLEAFASRAELETLTMDGARRVIAMDSEFVSKIPGPFHRAHTYVGLIGYAPRKPERIWRPVLRAGLCDGGPLALAAGISQPIRVATVRLWTTTAGRSDTWSFPIRCAS